MARPTVRTISRYLLRQHVAPLGFALAALTSLMLLNQIAKQFGSLVGKGLPWSVILEVFVLSVPFIVAVTLPIGRRGGGRAALVPVERSGAAALESPAPHVAGGHPA
ncbi:MAG: hypothetical protein AUI13_09775 [Gemmatimonadetes bacterium 13_2_20CM_2_69_23]|nr:MAG: hypothetical protein AUI13_09775 [Gemmatimonadetes bacterium 13_2_20CM_2_69_23]